MERVTGIGGFFFAARDPGALAFWYAGMLGVDVPPASYDASSWRQKAGPTVFAAMSADSEHLDAGNGAWSVNFRVDDLDAMVRQLRDASIRVEVDPETYPNGRFASLADPEGNAIQLWQPDGVDLNGDPAPDAGHRGAIGSEE